MSAASEGQRIGTVALGVANLVGVVVLGSLLADPQVMCACALSCISHAIFTGFELAKNAWRLTSKLPIFCRFSTRWHAARWRLSAVPCPCCRCEFGHHSAASLAVATYAWAASNTMLLVLSAVDNTQPALFPSRRTLSRSSASRCCGGSRTSAVTRSLRPRTTPAAMRWTACGCRIRSCGRRCSPLPSVHSAASSAMRSGPCQRLLVSVLDCRCCRCKNLTNIRILHLAPAETVW